jgi:hypothetical protein
MFAQFDRLLSRDSLGGWGCIGWLLRFPGILCVNHLLDLSGYQQSDQFLVGGFSYNQNLFHIW